MTDFLLLEQLHKMVLDLPKPRLMHKKGISARGFFRPYMSLADYTEAEIFESIDRITSVTVRFSSMLGEKGRADTMRNIKGFSAKFFGEEGNFDLICQSLPVFFIHEEGKLSPLREALTIREGFDGIHRERFWRFLIENPEAVNCALRLYSREGLLDSFLCNQWYSVNTYIWRNGKGEKFALRYKWVPLPEDEGGGEQTSRPMNRNLAEFMAGFDPDRALDQLERQISSGRFPSFELQVQMTDGAALEDRAYTRPTLSWEEERIKPMAAGVLKLTDLAEEQDVCFAPGNTLNGMELYRDGLSQMMDWAHRIGGIQRGGRL